MLRMPRFCKSKRESTNMTIEDAFLLIEEKILQNVDARGGKATWTEVMEPLGLLGPCEPYDAMKGYASGFFVERLKDRGNIQVHQVAPRHRKILVTRKHPDWDSSSIRKI